jgi:hypothetical protein
MSNAGVTTGFAPVVAHAIHSLTLEDIRHYFKSDATENNGIPTGKHHNRACFEAGPTIYLATSSQLL